MTQTTDPFRLLAAVSEPGRDPAGRVEAKARIRFTVAQALAQGRVGFHYQPVVQARRTRGFRRSSRCWRG